VCDVDERGASVPRFQAAYGGSDRSEPVSVPSVFRSDGVIALCLLIRSGGGAGPTLRSLALNDNCLVEVYDDRGRDPDEPRYDWARTSVVVFSPSQQRFFVVAPLWAQGAGVGAAAGRVRPEFCG